jgi:hypothetical protein
MFQTKKVVGCAVKSSGGHSERKVEAVKNDGSQVTDNTS